MESTIDVKSVIDKLKMSITKGGTFTTIETNKIRMAIRALEQLERQIAALQADMTGHLDDDDEDE